MRVKLQYTRKKSYTRVSKSQAKSIVRKAGPMDRRMFVDTDRSASTVFPRSWISAGSSEATGWDSISLFGAADFEDNVNATRERVQVTSLEFRAQFYSHLVQTEEHSSQRLIMWNLVAGPQETLAELDSNHTGPWDGFTAPVYANTDGIYTLRRGRFILPHAGSAATPEISTSVGSWANGNQRTRDMLVRHKRNFWLGEGSEVRLFYQWWTVLGFGTSAAIPAVIGSIDSLIRYSRY